VTNLSLSSPNIFNVTSFNNATYCDSFHSIYTQNWGHKSTKLVKLCELSISMFWSSFWRVSERSFYAPRSQAPCDSVVIHTNVPKPWLSFNLLMNYLCWTNSLLLRYFWMIVIDQGYIKLCSFWHYSNNLLSHHHFLHAWFRRTGLNQSAQTTIFANFLHFRFAIQRGVTEVPTKHQTKGDKSLHVVNDIIMCHDSVTFSIARIN
jgi:hypothetical protein